MIGCLTRTRVDSRGHRTRPPIVQVQIDKILPHARRQHKSTLGERRPFTRFERGVARLLLTVADHAAVTHPAEGRPIVVWRLGPELPHTQGQRCAVRRGEAPLLTQIGPPGVRRREEEFVFSALGRETPRDVEATRDRMLRLLDMDRFPGAFKDSGRTVKQRGRETILLHLPPPRLD